MNNFFQFLTDNSEAIMVILTFFYGVFTTIIAFSNMASARAAKKQTAENINEWSINSRLSILPYIFARGYRDDDYAEGPKPYDEGEFALDPLEPSICIKLDEIDYFYIIILKLENIGEGPARDITFSLLVNDDLLIENGRDYFFEYITQKENVKLYLKLYYKLSSPIIFRYIIKLNLEYKDLLENKYIQSISMVCDIGDNNLNIRSVINQPPVLKENKTDKL